MAVLFLPFLALLAISSVAAINVSSLDGHLLLGDARSIRAFDMNGNELSVVVPNPAQSIVVDCANNELLWADWFARDVYVQGNELTALPLPKGLMRSQWKPRSVAVDSINHNIYVANNYEPSIYIYEKFTGQQRRIQLDISSKLISIIWEIAVDAESGYLFAQNDIAITRTNLNGEEAQVICSHVLPNQKLGPLTISKFSLDTQGKRLYAFNYINGELFSVDYDGKDKVVHAVKETNENTDLFDVVTVLNGFLYWFDYNKNILTKIDLLGRMAEMTFSLDAELAGVIKGVKC